jgi:hypothetical protein
MDRRALAEVRVIRVTPRKAPRSFNEITSSRSMRTDAERTAGTTCATPRCPPEVRNRAEFMLNRLGLGRGEQVMRSRRAFHEQYRSGVVKIEHLDKVAPLLARAIRKEQAAAPTAQRILPL